VAIAFQRRFEREVGATPAEFRRALGLAHPDGLEESEGRLCLTDGDVRLAIRLAPQPGRRLGLFELPVLRVSYQFESGTPEGCRALLSRLDLAMQRGGG